MPYGIKRRVTATTIELIIYKYTQLKAVEISGRSIYYYVERINDEREISISVATIPNLH